MVRKIISDNHYHCITNYHITHDIIPHDYHWDPQTVKLTIDGVDQNLVVDLDLGDDRPGPSCSTEQLAQSCCSSLKRARNNKLYISMFV